MTTFIVNTGSCSPPMFNLLVRARKSMVSWYPVVVVVVVNIVVVVFIVFVAIQIG